MDEQLCEDIIKAHGERVAGVLKIVKSTPTDELTKQLVKELTELLEDSFAAMVMSLSQLEAEASKRPRQTRMDEFLTRETTLGDVTARVEYGEQSADLDSEGGIGLMRDAVKGVRRGR